MDMRYPIGKYKLDAPLSSEKRHQYITQIEQAPALLRQAVNGLSPQQLDTTYRPDGWTVRQVVHHLADSHLNNYVRIRLALTEPEPMVKPYHEDRWAELFDARTAEISLSMQLLDALHARWILLLKSLKEEDFQTVYHHPENGRMTLDHSTSLYAWHGRRHTAHITGLRERMGWQ